MAETVQVESIALYPIKSLDPVFVPEARILPSGALEHDREFALADAQGNWINGKREPRLHRIRAAYDLHRFQVALIAPEQTTPRTFNLLDDQASLEQWFAETLGAPAFLKRNVETGFPDDLDSPGPTIVSAESFREVGSWFAMHDSEMVSRRFRANITLRSSVPFWEDRLLGDSGENVAVFRIGAVTVHGVNSCQRCSVPSRDPNTGVVTAEFKRLFAARRAALLPAWAPRSRFDHFYRLTVNTRIPASEAGKAIRVGDPVTL